MNKTYNKFAKIDDDGFIVYPKDVIRVVEHHHSEYDMPVYAD